MPIVTSGLIFYANTKDGLSAGKLNNLAPGGDSTWQPEVFGATPQASDGSLLFDGVDDYLSVPMRGPFYDKGQSWTIEIVHTPINRGSTAYSTEVIVGNAYMDLYVEPTYSSQFIELYPNNGYTGVLNAATGNVNALRVFAFKSLAYRFNATTKVFSIVVDGVQVYSTTMAANVALAWANGATNWFKGEYNTPYWTYLHGIRAYNRALTDAELVTNFNEGKEIGLGTPVVPQVKIGELRVAPGAIVPIYSITNHPTQPLRVQTANGLGFIPMVLVADALASKIRLQTHLGLRSLKK